ncbi:hypothetical protein PVAP13_4KG244200 [Panicum virgatum]|uniref:Uncharacterized protein n=1 Tax=Panicum virgatum TaxID=38727 RepID=A0A8T0TQT8_PANVG|nr:hypothetical protein PVAP13_4KG244200 [Panicum virgatum]
MPDVAPARCPPHRRIDGGEEADRRRRAMRDAAPACRPPHPYFPTPRLSSPLPAPLQHSSPTPCAPSSVRSEDERRLPAAGGGNKHIRPLRPLAKEVLLDNLNFKITTKKHEVTFKLFKTK